VTAGAEMPVAPAVDAGLASAPASTEPTAEPTAAATAEPTATAPAIATRDAGSVVAPTIASAATATSARTPAARPTADPPASGKPATGTGTTGTVRTAGSTPHRRIFVDEMTVGQTPDSVTVRCGMRSVRIGSSGKTHRVEVPCGGELTLTDR
jgi:hypothetical protein